MANRWEKMETVTDFIFLGIKITVDGDSRHEIKRRLFLGRKARQRIKKLRHHFVDRCPYSQSYGFSNSHVQMWELDHKGGCLPKNWCLRIVVVEKTLKSPLDSKQIKLVNSKETNPECSLEGLVLNLKLQYFGHLMQRTDREAWRDAVHGVIKSGTQLSDWTIGTIDT